MGEFTEDFQYEALIAQDAAIAKEIEQSKQNLSVVYQKFTETVRMYDNSSVIVLFDSVESMLCENPQILRLNYLSRVGDDFALLSFFTVSDVPINADTIRAAINCVNREMARRGRDFMVDKE